MKKLLLITLLFSSVISISIGQATDPKPGSAIPAFKMLMTNGKYFTNKDIQKGKPFVLVYFAPDCDHCLVLMDELFKSIHQLDKASVVLITFKPTAELTGFEKKYSTAKFHNIKVGTEGTNYTLRNFYRLDKTPFAAVYDKKGLLAFSYKEQPPVKEMLSRFKKLQ